MDVLVFKDYTVTYSYKGGLKTSSCYDLISIESDKPLIKLVLQGFCVSVKMSLCSIENQLHDCFMKINRQVIVNMSLTSQIALKNGSYWICMSNGIEYKISERNEKKVCSAFLKYT